ncbi:MAG: 50S ribosomal protein L33 [Candidatus Omnitrophota bacterium]|jgi:large subunit ribosomal protein L33
MAKKKEATEIVEFQCTECKRRNYTKRKNKRNNPDRIELSKYCRFDRKHTLHKEMK